jgi:hypothetical protein
LIKRKQWGDLTEFQRDALRILEAKEAIAPCDEPKKDIEVDDSEFVVTVDDPNLFSLSDTATMAVINTSSNITITCENGKEVLIDLSGDEVKVTGASEEGAKIFFELMLKPIIDDYLRRKKQ